MAVGIEKTFKNPKVQNVLQAQLVSVKDSQNQQNYQQAVGLSCDATLLACRCAQARKLVGKIKTKQNRVIDGKSFNPNTYIHYI